MNKKGFAMKNKYSAKKTEYKGIVYDSKKESRRSAELDLLEKYGKIKNLQRQVRFILQESFIAFDGKRIRPIYYIADFYYEQNNKKIVEDTKGFRTQVYLLKKKLFLAKYPDIIFIES